MKLNKKLLLSFGAIASVATPIVATVSCGSKHSAGTGGYNGLAEGDYQEAWGSDITKYDKELPDLPLIYKDPSKAGATAHTASTYDIAVNQFYSNASSIAEAYMNVFLANHRWITKGVTDNNLNQKWFFGSNTGINWSFASNWSGVKHTADSPILPNPPSAKTSFEGFTRDSKGNVYIKLKGWYEQYGSTDYLKGIFTFPSQNKYYLGTWNTLLGDFMHPFVHSSAEEVKSEAINNYNSSIDPDPNIAESMTKAPAWVDDHGVWNIPLEEINYVTTWTSSSAIHYTSQSTPKYPQKPLSQEDVDILKDPRTNFVFE